MDFHGRCLYSSDTHAPGTNSGEGLMVWRTTLSSTRASDLALNRGSFSTRVLFVARVPKMNIQKQDGTANAIGAPGQSQ